MDTPSTSIPQLGMEKQMKEKAKTYSLYITSGIIISLISTLYTQDLTTRLGAAVTGYGLPLPWLEETTPITIGVTSHYSLSWYGLGLLADIIFWSIIVRILHYLYKHHGK